MSRHDHKLVITEDVRAPLYVVQPLPLFDIYFLAALTCARTEGVSAERVAERAHEIAKAAMAKRDKQ